MGVEANGACGMPAGGKMHHSRLSHVLAKPKTQGRACWCALPLTLLDRRSLIHHTRPVGNRNRE